MLLFGKSLMQGSFPLFKTITKNLAFVLKENLDYGGCFGRENAVL